MSSTWIEWASGRRAGGAARSPTPPRSRRAWFTPAAALTLIASAAPAAAEPWVTAEIPAAWPVSEPHARVFRAGALPTLAVGQPLMPRLALVARARAGLLGDGAAPDGMRDPGRAGLLSLGVGPRLQLGGAWLEAVIGGGVTGDDPIGMVDLGAGWQFTTGAVRIGPAVHLIHVEGRAGDAGLGDADLLVVGFELGRARRRPGTMARAARDRDRLRDRLPVIDCDTEPGACQAVPADHDRAVDVLMSCRALASVMPGAVPGDGCAPPADLQVHSDRIVLSEAVLFAVNRARVRRRSRPAIAAVVAAWRTHRWAGLVIEGHTDVRGPDQFNRWLSVLRAERVETALIAAGVPSAALTTVGRGAESPRAPGHDERAHALNRRVEFVIVREARP